MTTYLLKTEPDDFAYADLVRLKEDPWTGVKNPTAQMHMRAMKRGDRALIYHTGNEKRVAGIAKVIKGAYPDPDHPGQLKSGEPKRVLVDLSPMAESKHTLTLAGMKADARFEGFDLVRIPRLSVMPVPEELDAIIRAEAGLPKG